MQQLVAESSKLNVRFDVHEFTLSEAERARMIENLQSLGRHAAGFPVADLHVHLEFNRPSRRYSVKLALILPGTTLAVTEQGEQAYPAFDLALAVLHDRLTAYKGSLDRLPERQRDEKGTAMKVEPTGGLDTEKMAEAARERDYAAFRVASLPYEETLRKRIGRLIERYPGLAAQIGRGLEINDILEGVFLSAMEQYESRPLGIRFGDWLEGLIDPVAKAVLHDRDKELENINLARTAVEAQGGPGLGR